MRQFGAFGAMNHVHDVVRLAVELFGDVHLGFRSLDADVGADKGARFAFLLVLRSGRRQKILANSVHACRRLQFDRTILRMRIVEGW